MSNLKKLLFDEGLNQRMLASKLSLPSPYVSMYISGIGSMPRKPWQIIHEYFLELRYK